MASPEISVVMPFRDAAATLPAALASVARQRGVALELLAVDDGSADGSAELVADLARADGRVRLITPGRVGLVGALRAALAEARAPLVARMDADDLAHPDRLRLQRDYLAANPGVALVASRVALFPRRLVRAGYAEYIRWQNSVLTPADVANNIYVESPFAHPSVTLRRAALEAAGGYRDGHFPEDYELWLRMHAAGMAMAKLPRVLLAWRESEGRASRTDPRYAREAFDALRAEYLARDPRLASGRELVYWGAGRNTRLRARCLIERGFPPAAWVDIDPDKIGQVVWGAPVRPRAWLARAQRPYVLVYVTNHGARELIAGWLAELGYAPGADYLFVG
jgi:glycosyltransferase involved in cell wall biosynthesis